MNQSKQANKVRGSGKRRHAAHLHHPMAMAVAALMAMSAVPSFAQSVTPMVSQQPNTVSFRKVDGVPLTSLISNLPVAGDEGLWRESRGLPDGSRVLLTASNGQAPANGSTAIALKIELFDAKGQPYLQPTKVLVEVGMGSLEGPDGVFAEGLERRLVQGNQLKQVMVAVSNGVANLVLRAPSTAGDAVVKASSGSIAAQGVISFVPDLRDWMALGIVEGAIKVSKLTGPAASDVKQLGFSDDLRNWSKTTLSESSGQVKYKSLEGRAAFFIKGTIKGEYLLTAAADSDKITAQKMFRDIDPNAYYPVYGDTSIKEFEAQSRSRLFVRVEKDKNYLLYGDFQTETGDLVGKLASLGQTHTGLKTNYETESVQVSTFLAKTANKTFVDEQMARGISGPYALGQANALVNTEIVEILVRDRSQLGSILKRTTMTRFVDYDFEPFSGRILFRQPVASVDEQGNPQYIRISYAVEEEFAPKHWVGGVSAKVKLGAGVTVGASYAKENDALSPHELLGAHVEIKLGDKTYFTAEAAQSKGTNLYNQRIDSPAVADGVKSVSGNAFKAELRHSDETIKGRVYVSKTDATFQNVASGVAAGKTEAGVDATVVLTPKLSAHATVVGSKDQSGTETDGAQRKAASLSATYDVTDRVRVEAGVNRVKETLINGSSGVFTSATLTNGENASTPGWGFNGTGLLASPASTLNTTTDAPKRVENEYTSARVKVLAKVTDDTSVSAEVEQGFADTSKRRIAIGGEVRLDEKSRLYAIHELQNTLTGLYGVNNDGSRHSNTVVGISSAIGVPMMPDGQVYGEYRSASAINGTDVAAVAGIRSTWRPRVGIGITAALERQRIVQAADGSTNDATAVSLAGEYAIDAANQVAGKLEWRNSSTQEQVLATAAYTRVLSNNWSALAKNAYSRFIGVGRSAEQGIQTQNQFQLGLAYRDTEEGRWSALARLEHRLNQSTALADPRDERAWIASLHGNYKLSPTISLMGQLAAKRGSDVIYPDSRISGYRAALASGRVIWDITDRFDASVYGSIARDQNQTISGYGLEVGARVVQDMWLSAGYTHGRFADVDAFGANTQWSGWHMRLRYKFDEETLRLTNKDASKQDTPKQEATKLEATKLEALKQDVLKQDVLKQDVLKQDVLKQNAPKQDAPKQDAPQSDAVVK